MMYHSTMFEEMGFQYAGPVDGHDVLACASCSVPSVTSRWPPLFLHVCTQKGKGYPPAEENPGEFHGVSAFDFEGQKLDPTSRRRILFPRCSARSWQESLVKKTQPCAL